MKWSKKRKSQAPRSTKAPRETSLGKSESNWVVECWCPRSDPATGFIEIHSSVEKTIEKFVSHEDFGKKRLPDGTWVFDWKSRWCCVVDIERAGDGLCEFKRLVAISTREEYPKDYKTACKLAKEVEKQGNVVRIRRKGTQEYIPSVIL